MCKDCASNFVLNGKAIAFITRTMFKIVQCAGSIDL